MRRVAGFWWRRWNCSNLVYKLSYYVAVICELLRVIYHRDFRYIPTGRCLKTFNMNAPVTSVSYSPNPERTLVLVGCESQTVTLMNIECGDKLRVSTTREFLQSLDLNQSSETSNDSPRWTRNKQGNIEIGLPDVGYLLQPSASRQFFRKFDK